MDDDEVLDGLEQILGPDGRWTIGVGLLIGLVLRRTQDGESTWSAAETVLAQATVAPDDIAPTPDDIAFLAQVGLMELAGQWHAVAVERAKAPAVCPGYVLTVARTLALGYDEDDEDDPIRPGLVH